jgi:hypothetical protein
VARNAAIRTLLEVEQRDALWERRVLGTPVWAMERLNEYRKLQRLAEGASSMASNQPAGARRVQVEIETFLRGLSHNVAGTDRAGRDLWVLSSSSYRRPDAEGALQCPWTADLEEQLGPRLLFLESNTARVPSLDRSDHAWVDGVQVPALIASRYGGHLLGGIVRREMASLTSRRVWDRALYGRWMRRAAVGWLKLAVPRAVFVIDAYGMFVPVQMELKRRGIPLIELQHGVIHGSHPGYVFGDDLPATPQPWPDHLVTFGERFGETVEESSRYWRGRWSVGGHPRLRQRAGSSADGSNAVVLFGQGDRPVMRRIRAVARELRRILPTVRPVRIKPHPREFGAKKFYAEAAGEGVEVLSAGDDTYRLLEDCAAAVCEFSTVAVEALAWGCRSFLLRSPHWSDVLTDFVDQGFLEPVDGAADIALALERGKRASVSASLGAELFGVGRPALDFEALVAQEIDAGAGAAPPAPRG